MASIHHLTPQSGGDLTDYLHYLEEQDYSPVTRSAYKRDLLHFAAYFTQTTGEPFSAAAVTRIDVLAYKTHARTELGHSAATVNRRLATLRGFFSWAEATTGARAPTARIKNVRLTQLAPQALDQRQQRALLRAAERHGDARDRALVVLLLEAGLRTSEACRLRLGDLHLGERKGTALIHGGKGDKDRTVPLNRDVRAALKEYLEARPVCAAPEVFLSRHRRACSDDTVQATIRRLGQLAGLEGLTARALRHTFARTALLKGVDLATVQAMLGHNSVATTSIYVKASQADLEEAVEKLAWGD